MLNPQLYQTIEPAVKANWNAPMSIMSGAIMCALQNQGYSLDESDKIAKAYIAELGNGKTTLRTHRYSLAE